MCFFSSKPKPRPRKTLTRADVDRLYPVRPHQLIAQEKEKARVAAGMPGLGERYAAAMRDAELIKSQTNPCSRPSRYAGLV
jgi:hypothetical protein